MVGDYTSPELSHSELGQTDKLKMTPSKILKCTKKDPKSASITGITISITIDI